MADAPFDPSGAITFDLPSGCVNLAHASARVLVPADGVATLCHAAGEHATREFGYSIGTAMGKRLAQRLGQGAANVSMQTFLQHLRGEFALVGFGVVGMQQWADALLLIVEHTSLPSDLIAATLESALAGSTNRTVVCVKLMEEDGKTRFLLGGPQGAKRVTEWLEKGMFWGEVLVRLHSRHDPDARGDA